MSPAKARPTIKPHPAAYVCCKCGSLEIECLDYVRVNDDLYVGGNQVYSADDYWCPECEVHGEPVQASEYCELKGHTGTPCKVCGRRER